MTAQGHFFLRALTIHRYEQFVNCPRVEFSPDTNLLLGINGSGKTSLLRLLAAVLRFDYTELRNDSFHIEFESVFRAGDGAEFEIDGEVKNLLEPAKTDTSSGPGAGRVSLGRARRPALEARFELRRHGHEPLVYIAQDGRMRLDSATEPGSGDLIPSDGDLFYGLINQLNWRFPRTITFADSLVTARNAFFVRETDIDFLNLTQEIECDGVFRANESPEFEDLGGSSSAEFRQWHPFVTGMLEKFFSPARSQGSSEAQRDPVVYTSGSDQTSTGLSFGPLLDALGADQLSVRLKIEKEQRKGGYNHFEGRGVELRVRFRSGLEVVDSKLTFGQKRLLTIGLAALSTPGVPMLIDELDNGLHPELVEKALDFLGERQSFIASHNPLVVDLVNYYSADDICQKIHICRRNQDGSQTFELIDAERARDIHEKIDIGILRPSQVLLNEGLW